MAPPYTLAYTVPKSNQFTPFQVARFEALPLNIGEFEFLGLTQVSDAVVELANHMRREVEVNPTADFLANYPTDETKRAALTGLFDHRIGVALCTYVTLSEVTL